MSPTLRSHRSSGSYGPSTKVDNINNPCFKLPFNHGWKRELVKRNPKNKSKIQYDVYYFCPKNKKLRSLKEIQKRLNSERTPLTINNFTFLKKLIGIESKEVMRDAISKGRPWPKIMEADAVIEPLNTTTSTPERQAEKRQASQSTVSPPKHTKLEMENSPNVKQRTFEITGLSAIHLSGRDSYLKSFNDMSNSLKCVFAYLKMEDLLTVTRWQNVQLKNVMVSDWKKLVEFLNMQRCISLDTGGMLMPSKVQDFNLFWSNFSKAISNATKLEVLKLYKCPIRVVHDVMCSLHQLEKLHATSIKNPHVPEDIKIVNEFMPFNMDCVSDMINLTELIINGQTGIKLLSSQELTFSSLTKLKTLSLTSIKSFPKNICTSLGTISIDLEALEIGDCDDLPNDFPMFLKKLTNLRSLRLENCCVRWEKCAKENFDAIRSMKKLKKLELINIEFSDSVAKELAKCDGITALLIIPIYECGSAEINCHLIDCLKKLSKTLTHVVWGLTHQIIKITDIFITQYKNNQHNLGYNIDMLDSREPFNTIPILKSRKLKLKPQLEDLGIPEINKDKSNKLDLLSVPRLQCWLDSMMVNTKTKIIKIPFSATTQVHLSEQFDDI